MSMRAIFASTKASTTVLSMSASGLSRACAPMQLALAWLLQRSRNILLIPGTSSVAHLRENLDASMIQIPAEVLRALDSNGGRS